MAECIFREYVVPAMPLLAAALVYVLGLCAYFRQKEYELITKRYLDEGIDAISKSVEASLASFRHNWWQSTVVLKHFRDLEKDIPKELYADPFIVPKTDHFELWRDYRLNDVVGDPIINKARQSLDAFEKTSYAFFKYDLCSAVRVTVEGGTSLKVIASIEKMVEQYLQEVDRLDNAAKRYYVLLGELQNLASILQTERFSFKSLRKLRRRDTVKGIVNRLRAAFPDEPEPGNAPEQTHAR